MTAVLVPTTSEEEWLAARRQGVTASEIAVLMGLSPYSSPYALYHQKTGDLPGQEDDMAMAIGRHFEDFVADRFAEMRPEFWASGDGRQLYGHPERPWQMATPDRILFERPPEWLGIPQDRLGAALDDTCAVLECKTDGGYDGWGDDGTDEIPVHYRCQVLWQMDVLGVQTGFVACLFMNRRQLRVYELTMDTLARSDLELMRREATAFLGRIEPPDVDWRPATSAALKRLHPDVEDRDVTIGRQLAISYRAACRHYKDAERRKDEMTNRVLAAIGDGRRAIEANTGLPVAGRQVYDVRESVRKAYTVRKLVPARAPKEPSS